MVTEAIARLRCSFGRTFVLLACLVLATFDTALANPRYAAIVVDVDSGEVLHAANADETRYPASLTKMMTLYMLFEALESRSMTLQQGLPVSANAAAKPASKLYVQAGSTIPVETAIHALVVKSANDVATVVGEALGGSEEQFARMMTAKARELGMPRTTFRNASGLPDGGQTTTARDMATLSVRLMEDFPQYYHYFGVQSFSYRGTTHNSHNRLVRNYPGADGLKTGFIRASGFNVATSAVRDDRRLVSVVMGGFTAASRDTHMADLLDRGFVRASLYGRGDWVAQADFSGERMDLQRAPAPAAPPREPERQIASQSPPPAPPQQLERQIASQPAPATPPREAERQVASLAPAQPVARDSLPQTAQGSANDPIRELMTRSEPPAAPGSTVAQHRLEPAGSSWGVQVGAFSSQDNARSLASLAADRLGQDLFQARVDIDEVAGSQTIFRARLVNLDENQAHRACRSLEQQGLDCMVINAAR